MWRGVLAAWLLGLGVGLYALNERSGRIGEPQPLKVFIEKLAAQEHSLRLPLGRPIGPTTTTPDQACRLPLSYDVGTVDPRFKLNAWEFAAILEQAAGIWERGLGRKVFEARPRGKPINLVWDGRQEHLVRIAEQRDALDRNTAYLAKMNSTIAMEDAAIQAEKSAFQADKQHLEQMIQRHNTEVQSLARLAAGTSLTPTLGTQIGYRQARLAEEGRVITRSQDALMERSEKLNQRIDALNEKVKTLNHAVQSHQAIVTQFNASLKFKESFVQGEHYSGTGTLNIYAYTGKTDLVTVIAHEMGHRLGIDHAKNPDSLMYAENRQSTQLSAEDIRLAREAIQKRACSGQ